MTAPRLTVVATPIGNLEDLSPRAAAALRDADLIACEDTRRTRILTQHVGAHAEVMSVHQHNEAERTATILERVRSGDSVVLVSDAGMPSVSDPGARVVAAAHAADLEVSVIPGPSAVTSAIAAAGMAERAFAFVGFFPRKATELRQLLDAYDGLRVALVGFESPNRVTRLLELLAERDPDREITICRELTKLHEEIIRCPAGEAAEKLGTTVRGEVTLVLAPAVAAEEAPDLRPALRLLAQSGVGARASAKIVAALGAASKNAAYAAALELARESESAP
ncbi:MAG: 16S rRNA (cytidine(1402)-2'-O)-methyltransferase [Thermoleophilia bacterium]|nr:16S rRNA (cytidine(1402)-2'-O)-methyltransferase [Thermoleophilia bacterium]MDH3724202.1 16S rRNA (cytidine(1402)-2'-O)-methyltransferase [Thermoleophilia bacterium]